MEVSFTVTKVNERHIVKSGTETIGIVLGLCDADGNVTMWKANQHGHPLGSFSELRLAVNAIRRAWADWLVQQSPVNIKGGAR
jgi:hypothetical protein